MSSDVLMILSHALEGSFRGLPTLGAVIRHSKDELAAAHSHEFLRIVVLAYIPFDVIGEAQHKSGAMS